MTSLLRFINAHPSGISLVYIPLQVAVSVYGELERILNSSNERPTEGMEMLMRLFKIYEAI